MLKKLSLLVIYPISKFFCRIFAKNKLENLERFFIDINNWLVIRTIRKKPEKLLLLMPHCLQFSDCEYRVTGKEIKCKMCGKCEIKDLMDISKKYDVRLSVATGGTMARNIIKEIKPDLIIATACERDLISGLKDTVSLPVIGILNERPNGPCIDTRVDLCKITTLIDFLKGLSYEKK
ncbi:MAG: DUF116 domain-containing protein [Proteobacteria bacterium]|nr:DUF116 domain-containing protein [Pseudomonadota bacterium]